MTPKNIEELQIKLQQCLSDKNIKSAIDFCETELQKVPTTDYHKILGKELNHLIDPLIFWIDTFYNHISKQIDIEAMYCEMNGFTINPDLWFADLFAFDDYQGTEDLDWLADFEYGHCTILQDPNWTGPPTGILNSFLITSLEELQSKFEWKMGEDEDGNPNYKKTTIDDDNAEALCEHLIVLRLQELFDKAYIKAKASNDYSWANIPIIVTAHDWDMIYEINGNA